MQPIIYCLSLDTRLKDNPALYAAMQTRKPVIFVYIMEDDVDAKEFSGELQRIRIRESLIYFKMQIKKLFNAKIIFAKGTRFEVIADLIEQTNADAVYWNRRYLPYQVEIDTHLKKNLKQNNINAQSFKANLLFEPYEIKNKTAQYYKVYSPFKRACIAAGFDTPPLPEIYDLNIYIHDIEILSIDDLYPLPKAPDWSRNIINIWDFSEKGALRLLDNFIENGINGYKEQRNYPSLTQHTSCLSPYLAQGLISPRQIMYMLKDLPQNKDTDHFKSEILWREFSYYLVYHAPYMLRGNFKPEWDHFPWLWQEKDQKNFTRWCHGQTGVPIIDAAMKQLWQTGYMHNRCRMIVASYLVKHLLIDWKHGEAWFKNTLCDYDTANNIAGWQWVSGTGADAAPYFRIFNPILQSKKFDADANYIKKYLPELKNISNNLLHEAAEGTTDLVKIYRYYLPLIDHNVGRERALSAYEKIKIN